MSWTYSNLLTADKDKVRLYVGDTESVDPQLSDEEIAFILTQEGSVRNASALACEMLAAKYARLADIQEGQLKLTYSQRFEHYTAKAEMLRSSAAIYAVPAAGGISVSDKATVDGDTDRVEPAFARGMLDSRLVGKVDVDTGTTDTELS